MAVTETPGGSGRVRYHILTAAALFVHPGEIPAANHVEIIGDRQQKTVYHLSTYVRFPSEEYSLKLELN